MSTDFLAEVKRSNLAAAIQAALKGPEKKKIRIARHEFNVKPVTITRRDDGSIVVDGGNGHHISHHVSMSPDDQVYFSVTKKPDGSVEPWEPRIEKWGPWIPELIAVLTKAYTIAKATGVLKADGGVDEAVLKETATRLDGTWKGEAKFLIANIVLAAT
jgi:hypothetical protein